jgi:hypothetical protein
MDYDFMAPVKAVLKVAHVKRIRRGLLIPAPNLLFDP